MAEKVVSVITDARRVNLCKVTSGAVSTIPKITHIAFGDGGVDSSGEPITPVGSQTALKHEIGRYAITSVTYPVPTTARYTTTIPADALVGKKISEAALVDASGGLAAIRTMYSKGKDKGTEFIFTYDDEF